MSSVDDGELTWTPPGAGLWWLVRDVRRPVSGLLAAIFPPVTAGWSRAAAHYGLPRGELWFRTVNGYLYCSVGDPDPDDYPRLEEAARATLDGMTWRAEWQQWSEVERGRVVD